MKNTQKQNKSFLERFLPVYSKIITTLLDRYLYITISVMLFWCSASLWRYSEIGQAGYLTVPNEFIGNKPGRFWGLLSNIDMSLTQIRIMIFVITILITLCAAVPVYLFIRDFKDDRNKIFAVFGTGLAVMIPLFGYKYMMWDYASLSLYTSLMLLTWSAYSLHKTGKKYIAILFAAAAELVDCRAILFLFPVILLVVFVKKIHKDNKQLKFFNMLTLSAAALILVLSFTSVDMDFQADEDAIDNIFTERFIELGNDEEKIDKAAWAFKFNAYLRVSPMELIGDSFTEAYLIKDIIYEDHFQLIVLLFFSTIILYDHKDDYTIIEKEPQSNAEPQSAV